jgi:glycosyltransferase involved in cell wall biosynthesis
MRRERLTHRLGAALIVNSRAIRHELERGGIRGVEVVDNGVDGARFAPLAERERASTRTRLGFDGETFVVPARIAYQKNQLAVVRAVAALRSRGRWPRAARVVFAGRVESHTDYVRLVDAAMARFGVRDVVRRIEPVHDMERVLAAADATLLPSRFEGLPNAVLESLSCGTPAIVSRAANATPLVDDGVTGLVLDEGARGEVDADSVGRGMLRFLAMSPGERAAMGARGRADMGMRFGIARMVDATCAIYERVADARARRREAA